MMSVPNFPWGRAASDSRTRQERLAGRLTCLGEICPWCILDVRHGHIEEARQRVNHLYGQLSWDAPLEPRWIVQNCLNWCERHCAEFPAAAAGDAAGSSTSGSASSSRRPVPPPPHPPPRSDASSMQPRDPRAPPAAAAPASASHGGTGAAAQGPRLDESGVPLPGHLDAQWDFECWTGRSLKWVAYPEQTQERLRASYNGGGGVEMVVVNESHVEVSTTPDDMWQNNPNTEAKARKVRLAPKGGWPE